jgi:hypothetical protein
MPALALGLQRSTLLPVEAVAGTGVHAPRPSAAQRWWPWSGSAVRLVRLLFWALVVFFIARRPGIPPMEDVTPLNGRRRGLAWGSFALLALILLPLPHAISPEIGLHCPYV